MTKNTYIKKATITWPALWEQFGMTKDNGGRWYPSGDTQEYVVNYLDGYRSPSRAWPNSYATAMFSQKFAKLVVANEPELAVKLKLATTV